MGALWCNASDVTYTLGAFAAEVRAGAFPTKDHAHSPSH
jgi:ketopantoate hydroxymethyltransferase